MTNLISPKYQMQLVDAIQQAIQDYFNTEQKAKMYIEKWHTSSNDYNGEYNEYMENFIIIPKTVDTIDVFRTLHTMPSELQLKIAIDLGIETPDFIPSIPVFRNEIKSSYATASATFEKAIKQIEEHPDTAIGLANSALESIVKEIMKDERMSIKLSGRETLYALTGAILRELYLHPGVEMPQEIKTIGGALMAISQGIEKLRSEKTDFHGKTSGDYIVVDPIYTYFVINTVTTVGLFLHSYYRLKFPLKLNYTAANG